MIRLSTARYPPTSAAALYFRPPGATDRCALLALIEVAGGKYERAEQGFEELGAKARELGADTLFSVTTSRAARTEYGLAQVLDHHDDPDVYSSHVVTGLAARCTEPSKEPPQLAYGPPTGKPDHGRLFEPRPAPAPVPAPARR